MAIVLMMLIAMVMRMSGDVGNRGDDDDGEADRHDVGDEDGVDAVGKRDGDDGGDLDD